jgi:YHS domain-containing protein
MKTRFESRLQAAGVQSPEGGTQNNFGGDMKRTIRSFALIVVAALSLQAFAHGAHGKKAHDKGKAAAAKAVKGEFLGKGDGVKTCPVTGDEIQNKDVKGRFFNRTVYFCCPDCLADAKKNPAAYLKKTQAEQVAATKNLPKSEGHHGDHHAQNPPQDPKEGEKQDSKGDEKKFMGKGDGIQTCPVTGEQVNQNLKYEVNGRVFYVCCEACADLVKKNPDLFLKPVEGEEKKEQEFLGKGDGVETCPVTGDPVKKELKGEVDGRTFYVCCAGCIEVVKKNPAAYLKKIAAK